MKKIGIVAEYNPFHNGHKYHIDEIKKKYENSIIILVLNGYFMQRGEISVLSKEDKTKIALEENIDIVLEHPFTLSSNSADLFAKSAVQMLNEFKCDLIIFGSESNDIDKLKKEALSSIKKEKVIDFKKEIKTGKSYPRIINSMFSNPNDILGISYIKAALENNYDINFETIKRTNNYHDIESNDKIISATNIRKKIKDNIDITKYTNYDHLIKNINYDLYVKLLKYKILTNDKLSDFKFVDEGIENKLRNEIKDYNQMDEYIKNNKPKRFTYNKMNRMFINILVCNLKNKKVDLKYIKVLGFNKKGQKYLKIIKKQSDLLISSKIPETFYSRQIELKAAIIYEMLTKDNVYEYEKLNKPIIKVD